MISWLLQSCSFDLSQLQTISCASFKALQAPRVYTSHNCARMPNPRALCTVFFCITVPNIPLRRPPVLSRLASNPSRTSWQGRLPMIGSSMQVVVTCSLSLQLLAKACDVHENARQQCLSRSRPASPVCTIPNHQ